MFAIDVIFEVNSIFLEVWSVNIADITIVLFVFQDLVVSVSELREGIKHNTWDDTAEENTKEYAVYCVVAKSNDLKFIHSLWYSTWNK